MSHRKAGLCFLYAGNTLDRTYDAVKMFGTIVNCGEGEACPIENVRARVMQRSQLFCRFTIFHVPPGTEAFQRANDAVLGAIADGKLEVPVVKTFPLAGAGAMHELLEGRSVSGKLLLEAGA